MTAPAAFLRVSSSDSHGFEWEPSCLWLGQASTTRYTPRAVFRIAGTRHSDSRCDHPSPITGGILIASSPHLAGDFSRNFFPTDGVPWVARFRRPAGRCRHLTWLDLTTCQQPATLPTTGFLNGFRIRVGHPSLMETLIYQRVVLGSNHQRSLPRRWGQGPSVRSRARLRGTWWRGTKLFRQAPATGVPRMAQWHGAE